MNIKVKLFAIQAQKAGTTTLDLELPDGATALSAVNEIKARFPEMPWPQRTMVAVNLSYVPLETTLEDGNEVALIPPVSGG